MQQPGLQGFPTQQLQGQFAPAGYTTGAPMVQQAPLTPKIQSQGIQGAQMQQLSMTAQPGVMGTQKINTVPMMSQPQPATQYVQGGREKQLENRVRELEQLLAIKEKTIQELTVELNKGNGKQMGGNSKMRSPPKGFRKVSESKPVVRYSATDQDDPIDVRLEEFYNSTGSAIQFRRINRGFYRFGDSIVELDIINHKLMARTEDGWNRGKFGPIEKFLMYYENIEREKAGILPGC